MKRREPARHLMRAKHFSYRTEQSTIAWLERFIRCHGIRHPNTMAGPPSLNSDNGDSSDRHGTPGPRRRQSNRRPRPHAGGDFVG